MALIISCLCCTVLERRSVAIPPLKLPFSSPLLECSSLRHYFVFSLWRCCLLCLFCRRCTTHVPFQCPFCSFVGCCCYYLGVKVSHLLSPILGSPDLVSLRWGSPDMFSPPLRRSSSAIETILSLRTTAKPYHFSTAFGDTHPPFSGGVRIIRFWCSIIQPKIGLIVLLAKKCFSGGATAANLFNMRLEKKTEGKWN